MKLKFLGVMIIILPLILAGCGKNEGIMTQDIEFSSDDGVLLKGTLYMPQGINEKLPGVTLAHMNMNDRTSWADYAEKLALEGYVVLTFDLRGWGGSSGESDVPEMYRDVMAAVTYLANFGRVDRDRIAAAGASMGGMASVIAATHTSIIKAVATVSSPPSWSDTEPVKVIGGLTPRPVLVIAGSSDPHLDLRAARMLFLAAREPRQWLEIKTNKHGTDIFATPQTVELERALAMFFAENLKKTVQTNTIEQAVE